MQPFDLPPSGDLKNSKGFRFWPDTGDLDGEQSSRRAASRSARCNGMAILSPLNKGGGFGGGGAKSPERPASSGMEPSCKSAINSFTSGGRLVGLEATGCGLYAFAADTSPHSTRPMDAPGHAVTAIGSPTPHGRQSRETASFCEPNASATA
jgi:hypothetical protein